MNLTEPFSTAMNMQTGLLTPKGKVINRYLSQMKGMFADQTAENNILAAEGDRLIYDVYVVELPETASHVHHCTTILYPGCIGDEYHMTKGHFHAIRDRGEVYLGMSGEGYVLLQTDEGEVRHVVMTPGAVVYIPPRWAHRTINSGDEILTFFSIWPGDAGHDYSAIEEMGFPQLLVNREGQPTFVDNPKYKRRG